MKLLSPTRKMNLLLDYFERVVLVILFAALCFRFYSSLDETPSNIIYLFSEGAVALFVLFRRSTDQISIKPFDWAVGIIGTMLPMLVIPSGNGWSIGGIFLVLGLVISLGAKFSLRRSFGVVAANRGVKNNGLYGVVRHPMYLGYFLTYIGIFILNPSVFNLMLLSLWMAFQVARIQAEERVLLLDPIYQELTEKVRFRLVPFVY